MTYDIAVNGYERYRHMYKNKEILIYGHRLNALINNSLKEVLEKHIHHNKPRKCFKVKCNGKNVEIGKQLDFVTCEIIHELIVNYSEEEVV